MARSKNAAIDNNSTRSARREAKQANRAAPALRASSRRAAVVFEAPSASVLHEEVFDAPTGRYRLREGEALVRGAKGASDRAHRGELEALFARVVVPSAERAGARGRVYPAEVPGGARDDEARWVAWQPTDAAVPVWGLYVAARVLDRTASNPANDTLALVAWGDGPAIAWVADHEVARSFVRAALHAPPAWLLRGCASRDATFPVRIDRIGASGQNPASGRSAHCTAVLPSNDETARSVRAARGERTAALTSDAGEGNAALALLRAWQRTHGREPFSG